MTTYDSYADLIGKETEGVDYRVRWRTGRSGIVIMAPHGGGIEPGTTEIAEAVACTAHAFYTFSGIKPSGNAVLHITSRKFDEPRGLAMVREARAVVTVHGCKGVEKAVYIGGRDKRLGATIRRELHLAGFACAQSTRFPGLNRLNICNRNRFGRGVQLELTEGLRRDMFKAISRIDRKDISPVFSGFVAAVQRALDRVAEC